VGLKRGGGKNETYIINARGFIVEDRPAGAFFISNMAQLFVRLCS
jgi:hypothetical protein